MKRTRISRLAMMVLVGGVACATTHVVVKGDTLWDITGHYLGNPFLWPTVWKRNTQIKNAHWIYPGDTVDVDGKAGGAPPTVDTSDNSRHQGIEGDPLASFTPGAALSRQQPQDTGSGAIDLVVPPESSLLNDRVYLMAPVLVPSSDSGRSGPQGSVKWDPETGHQEVLIGAQLHVGLGTDQGVKVGDRLLLLERDDEVASLTVKGLSGRLEQARGIAVVIETRSKSSLVRMEKVFGRIGQGAIARPWSAVPQIEVHRFLRSPDQAPDRVVANNRMGKIQMPGSFLMIDRGESSGVRPGDIYEFMDASQERGIAAMRGYGMVVRSTASTATIIVVGSTPKPVLPGDKAWRIRVAEQR